MLTTIINQFVRVDNTFILNEKSAYANNGEIKFKIIPVHLQV